MVKRQTLYRKVKGDQLFNLAASMKLMPNVEDEVYEANVHSALDAYEEAMDICEERLEPTNTLKVQLALKMSMALFDLSHFPVDAWVCGKKTLLRAEKYNAISSKALTAEETKVLQVLRDYVSMLEVYIGHHKNSSSVQSDRKFCSMNSLEEEENDDGKDHELIGKFGKGPTQKKAASSSLSLAHKVDKLRRLMKLDGSDSFLMASDLNHAQEIMSALRKIFKSYVRGNALSAQTKTGTYVTLDGRELGMTDFLLGGPYMSWDGFLFFCHDFNITPRRDLKGNRKLHTRAGESYLFPEPFEVQAIFTLTSLAPHEILKVQNEKREWSKGAREMWRDATQIARASLDPMAGLNFGNFVDCLARLALVAYSFGTWAEMFPSTTERIEAIFLTTMGVLNSSFVNANLHQHKKSQGLSKEKFKGMMALTGDRKKRSSTTSR